MNVCFITKANDDVISHASSDIIEENAILDLIFYCTGDKKYFSRNCLNIIQRML